MQLLYNQGYYNMNLGLLYEAKTSMIILSHDCFNTYLSTVDIQDFIYSHANCLTENENDLIHSPLPPLTHLLTHALTDSRTTTH